MKDKMVVPSSSFVITVVLSVMAVLLCCGEFIRIELILKQQKIRINQLENKMTSTLDTDKIFTIIDKVKGKLLESNEERQVGKHRQIRSLEATNNTSTKSRETQDQFIEIIKKEFNKIASRLYETKYGKVVPGPPGPPGPRGRRGRRGKRGFKGARGPMGHVGKNGKRGEAGLKGDPGEKGEVGAIGRPGARGMKGQKGEPGQSLEDPKVMVSPPRLIVNESESAIFHYSVRGNPWPVIAWSKVGGSLDMTRSIVNSSSGILEIKHVTSGDSGIYQCNVSSTLGKAQATSRLVVNYRPRMTLKSGPTFVKVGDNVTLPTCYVAGHPKPKITWSKSRKRLPKDRYLVKSRRLSLINVGIEDSGTYFCKAENLLGSLVSETMLIAVKRPVFTVKPPSILYAIKSTTIKLECIAQGPPDPIVAWKRKNADLPVGRNEMVDGSLVIKNVLEADSGVYVCTARSPQFFVISAETDLKVGTFRDCSEYYKLGVRSNGVYTIKPDSQGAFQVYCDMTTDGGGWTVFQRRQDGSVDFYLGWQKYKTGFGNLNGEFWLGNDYIHRLTARTASILRVELEDWKKIKKYAKYGRFSVGDETTKYTLRVASYYGTAGDSLIGTHNVMPFTTKDQDNDLKTNYNCAQRFTGAWWFKDCYRVHLNGRYLGDTTDGDGVEWYRFKRNYQSLKFTEMKLRPKSF